MNKLLAFTLLLFLLPLKALGQVYTIDNLPKVHLQDKTRYTCNPTGILSSEACDSIDKMLGDLESRTSIETVVAVVPSIGEADPFDFCNDLLNKWGVGKKDKNNGLVILLVIDQRRVQFYTGYGLEGDLPDAICKRIQTQKMLQWFRKGDWSKGMMEGVKATCMILTKSGSLPPSEDEESETGDDSVMAITFAGFLIFFGIFGLIYITKQRLRNKCPMCGSHNLRRVSSVYDSVNSFGIKRYMVTYQCRKCGNKIKRLESYNDENNHTGGGGGIFLGGFGGFGGDGGGFSGGSFGGGSGGGGGAGSSF